MNGCWVAAVFLINVAVGMIADGTSQTRVAPIP
jgi:hypothetical protein